MAPLSGHIKLNVTLAFKLWHEGCHEEVFSPHPSQRHCVEGKSGHRTVVSVLVTKHCAPDCDYLCWQEGHFVPTGV